MTQWQEPVAACPACPDGWRPLDKKYCPQCYEGQIERLQHRQATFITALRNRLTASRQPVHRGEQYSHPRGWNDALDHIERVIAELEKGDQENDVHEHMD